MKNSSFIKTYKKKRTPKIISLIAMIVLAFIVECFGIYTYYNNKNNAFEVTTIEDYKEALNNDLYLKISADKLYNLDVTLKETTSKLGIPISESINSHLVAIKLDPFVLTVALPKKEYNNLINKKEGPFILEGHLFELNDDDLVILRDVIKNNTELSNGMDLKPYLQYLQYESPIIEASFFLMIACLCFVYTIFLYMIGVRKNSIALKSLKDFSMENIENVYKQIDYEYSLPISYKNGPITITENYIIVYTQKIVLALPLKELVWIYKQTIKKKACMFIPVGKTTSLVLVFSDKNTYKVDLVKGDNVIDETIDYISKNCSTAFVGYCENFQTLLKKDPNKLIFKWKMNKESYKETNI